MTDLLKIIKSMEPAFISLIRERFGIVIHVNQTKGLVKTITEICHKNKCQPQDYLKHLKHCSSSSQLLTDLVAAITIGESYFFRDKNQMQVLEKMVLPRLIKEKQSSRTLKIWSAGCASGEEIYTIAMLLCELIPDMSSWKLRLLGTDINTLSLTKAAKGIYGQWSMRSIPENYIQRYFSKNGRFYSLSSDICNLVEFKYLNLSDNSYPSIINEINEIDLILCRNVLIYFDNELVTRIMNRLSACMANGSYLFLGASDPIVLKETNLVFHHNGAIYFTLNSSETKKDFISYD